MAMPSTKLANPLMALGEDSRVVARYANEIRGRVEGERADVEIMSSVKIWAC